MSARRIAGFCLLWLAMATALAMAADNRIRADEAAIETRLASFQWPSGSGGLVTVASCRSCASRPLRLTAATRLVWDGAPISRPQLQQRAAASRFATATVIYSRSSGEIIRIVAND